MTTAPQLPSHLRFMMAAVQDRALDLGLTGTASVNAELDIADGYALFVLVTRPGHCDHTAQGRTRITADLTRIVGIDFPQPLEEALAEARAELAAMLDHLNALIAQATAEEVPA